MEKTFFSLLILSRAKSFDPALFDFLIHHDSVLNNAEIRVVVALNPSALI
jgi:hypothetical protein